MSEDYEGRAEEVVRELRKMGMVIRRTEDRIEAVGGDLKVVIFSHGGWAVLRGVGSAVEARASVGNFDELLDRLGTAGR